MPTDEIVKQLKEMILKNQCDIKENSTRISTLETSSAEFKLIAKNISDSLNAFKSDMKDFKKDIIAKIEEVNKNRYARLQKVVIGIIGTILGGVTMLLITKVLGGG